MLNISWADADRVSFPSDPPISEYRRKKLVAIKAQTARRCSLCAELLLIDAVNREGLPLPPPFDILTDEKGKPFFAGREFEFSLSHSGHFAACALSDHPVGLDIQTLTACEERLVRRFFTQREQESVLSSSDRDAAFTRLWCRKESFLKAIGTGLRLPLDSFDASDISSVLLFGERVYALREFRIDDLFFCVCAPREDMPLKLSPREIVSFGV